jgi:CRISPR-associated protein Csb2
MREELRITITFLDPRFHGRRDRGEPEWPPSPLRLFQAIVAAAAAPAGHVDDRTADALRWFERLPPPRIATPTTHLGEPYRLSVPNNAMDLVAKAWAKGNYDGSGDSNPATHRTMKTVRPTHLIGGDQVQYVWTLSDPLSEADHRHAEAIRAAVRGIVALGWGIDLVVGHGEIVSRDSRRRLDAALPVQWQPGSAPGVVPLRVPVAGTFDALTRRHSAFLNRMTPEGFVPVPPLATFSVVGYRNENAARPRSFAAFKLISPQNDDSFASFPAHRAVCLAAMLRHAVWEAAKHDLQLDLTGVPLPDAWRTRNWAEEFVAGHGPKKPNGRFVDEAWPRFSYLPLPSITPIGVGDIRRVLIAEPFDGDGRSAGWAGLRLAGAELRDQDSHQCVAILQPLSASDSMLKRYAANLDQLSEWASVTPVILPGYDDGKPVKRERLLIECLHHAGLSLQAIESIESRAVSWFSRVPWTFKRTSYLKHLPAVHVYLRFKEPVNGPISLGAGRHCGLGVFAVNQLP